MVRSPCTRRLSAIAALLTLLASPAAAREDAPEEITLESAIHSFDRGIRKRDPGARIEAVRALADFDDPTVARRLLRVATSKLPYAIRTEALKIVWRQRASAKRVASTVARLLTIEAKRRIKGENDLELDKGGNVETQTPEGKRALQLVEDRNAFREAAVRCLMRLEDWRRIELKTLVLLLESGHDGLVTALLETFARWRDWRVLPEVCELYRIYPHEGAWRVSHLCIRSRLPQHAKGNYMKRFGDPNFLRARPAVVKAIRRTLLAITGEKFDSPEELMRFLRRPEVRKRIKNAPRIGGKYEGDTE